jgi:two-component sensor histidine kinase
MSVGVPKTELEAPIRRSLVVLGTLAVGGLLVSLVLAMIYGGWLVQRIKELEVYALAVGRREESGAVAVAGIAELDAVIWSLTEAATALRKHGRIQDSLIDELNHRVKNTLTIIQSIAWQTRKSSSTLEEFGKAFEGRLMALAKSHDALTRSGWRGSSLEDLVRAACRPFADESRVEINGGKVELRSAAVVSMAMVLHELATNAAKYGALSTFEGSISIHWKIERNNEGEVLHFEWKEHKGPPVVPFKKQGFGSLLILSIVEQDLRGKGKFVPEPDGLRFVASFPLNADETQSRNSVVLQARQPLD